MTTHPREVRLVVLATCDDVAREAIVGGVLLDLPGAAVLRYDHRWADGAGRPEGASGPDGVPELEVRRRVITADGVRWDDRIGAGGTCACCIVRDDLIDALRHLVATGRWSDVVVVPPLAAPTAPVATQLGEALAAGDLPGVRWGAVAAVVDVVTAESTLFGADLLAEVGRELSPHDRRAVGEAAVEQIEYADLVIGLRVGSASTSALRQLAPGRWAGDWTELAPTTLLDHRHDVDAGHARLDLLRLGGPGWRRDTVPGSAVDASEESDDPTWTLDLRDRRPFHPDRLLTRISELGSGRLRGRGHFWLPSRPDTPGVWNGCGGQLSIGSLAGWEGTPRGTRLMITGVDPADRDRVAAAFEELLVTPDELDTLDAWAEGPDGFEPWLGSLAEQAA